MIRSIGRSLVARSVGSSVARNLMFSVREEDTLGPLVGRSVAMTSDWASLLASTFGPHRLENCFLNTAFAPFAEKFGFGLYVIRAAMLPTLAQGIQEELNVYIEDIALKRGICTIQAKSTEGTLCYNTIHAVAGHCMCKSKNANTASHPVFRLNEVPVLEIVTSWLHEMCQTPPEQMFTEIVANDYSYNLDQAMGWHTDKNCLLRKSTDIVSLSIGAPGIFCYQPDVRSAAQFLEFPFGTERRNTMIKAGLRGFVPLFSGDILLMSGTFQEYLCHKTLRFTTAAEDVSAKYPGSCDGSKKLLPVAVCRGLFRDRACITWRLITNHLPICPDGRPFGQYARMPRLPSMVGSSVGQVASLVHSQNVARKRLKFDPTAGRPRSTGQTTPVPEVTVGNPKQDQESESDWSVSVDEHEIDELDIPCNLVSEAAVDVATKPRDIAQGQVFAKIMEARNFVECLDEVNKKYDNMLQYADKDGRMAIESAMRKLSEKLVEGQRVKVLADISQKAAEGFSQLERFEGSYGAIVKSIPANDNGRSWTKGSTGNRRSRCLRILTTTRNVLTFIRNADVSRSQSSEGIISVRQDSPPEEIYIVQQGEPKFIMFEKAVRFKSFELGLNYNELSARYILQPLSKNGATVKEMDARYGRFYKLLTTVIIKEKRRQMILKDTSAWPHSIPWDVLNVWSMPMVIWLYREGK